MSNLPWCMRTRFGDSYSSPRALAGSHKRRQAPFSNHSWADAPGNSHAYLRFLGLYRLRRIHALSHSFQSYLSFQQSKSRHLHLPLRRFLAPALTSLALSALVTEPCLSSRVGHVSTLYFRRYQQTRVLALTSSSHYPLFLASLALRVRVTCYEPLAASLEPRAVSTIPDQGFVFRVS